MNSSTTQSPTGTDIKRTHTHFSDLGLADSELRQIVRYIRDLQAHRKPQTD